MEVVALREGMKGGNGSGRRRTFLREETDTFDVLILIVLVLLVVIPPLAAGSISPWAAHSVFISSLSLLCLWLLQGARAGRLRVDGSSIWLLLGFIPVIGLVQLIPLPGSIVELISPGTVEIFGRALPEYAGGRGLSVAPHDTIYALTRFLAPAIVFLVTVSVVRTRLQASLLVAALVAIGSFEAFYGFAEHFSGRRHIFWNPKTYALHFVTGTFTSKNFYAGFLEMIVPVTIGFLFALGSREGAARSGGVRMKIITLLASPRLHQQAILAVSALAMILAVLFSLSRGGIISMAVGLSALALFVTLKSGYRRGAVAVIGIAAVTILVGSAVGMDRVAAGLADVGTGESISWLHRIDLSRSALGAVRDFPVGGTGFGTLMRVFTRYQSKQLGDMNEDYIHNDWLQIFCEGGVASFAIALMVAILFFRAVGGDALKRRSSYSRFLTVGLLVGMGSILLHDLFEHSLGVVPATGVVFAVIAGLAWSVSRLPSGSGKEYRRWKTVNLAAAPLRAGLAAAALIVFAAGVTWAVPRIRADIAFNRHLSAAQGTPGRYFFLPVEGEVDAGHQIERALALDPSNPAYHYRAGLYEQKKAEEMVREKAAANARVFLGEELEKADPEGFGDVVEALMDTVRPGLREERRPFMERSKEFLGRAIELAPTTADYHLVLSRVLEELREDAEAIREAETALWLAPNIPRVQYETGRIRIAVSGRLPDGEGDEGKKRGLEELARAIFIDPLYVDRGYPLLRMVLRDSREIVDLMPPSSSALERLYRLFWKEGDWSGAFACLERIEHLTERRFDSEGEDLVPARAHAESGIAVEQWEALRAIDKAFDRRSESEIGYSLAERKVFLLGVFGRWQDRALAVSQYREQLRERLGEDLEEARAMYRQGRVAEAMNSVFEILKKDWSFPEALLEAAEMSSLPRVASSLPPWQRTMDHLYRLVIHNGSLTGDEVARLERILDGEGAGSPLEKIEADFLRGAALVKSGDAARGGEILEGLTAAGGEDLGLWRQEHLVWHYLGLAWEGKGEREKARRSFRRAVEIVPGHLSSLLRLAALGDPLSRRLDDLEPKTWLNLDFGGRILMLGYTLKRDEILYHWQFTDRLEPDSWALLHYGDARGTPSYTHNHRIRQGGRVYPADFPRSGEVVVERFPLKEGRVQYPYLTVGIYAKGGLLHDGGQERAVMFFPE